MCDISSDNDSMDETLSEIRERDALAGSNYPLSEKSKRQYDKVYQNFMMWKRSKFLPSFDEAVLLEYFHMIGEKFKSSTLYTSYSILKCTLSLNHEVDISKYSKLLAYLKQHSEGYKGKKSKTFSPEEINKFLKEANDRDYLLTKIALIFGIVGACRRQELYKLRYKDVEVYGTTILVKLNNPLAKHPRTFAITGSYYDKCKKYIGLRPKPCSNPYFFLHYKAGKCIPQNVGINSLGNLGKTIASFLDLPNPGLYTGQCFRRTSARLSFNSFGDISLLTRQGRWKYPTTEENGTQENGTMDNSTTENDTMETEIQVPCLIPDSFDNNSNELENANFSNTTAPKDYTNDDQVEKDILVSHQTAKSFENKTIEFVNITLPRKEIDVCMDSSSATKDQMWNDINNCFENKRNITLDIPGPIISDGYNSDSMDNKSQVWHHVQNSVINNRSENAKSNTPSTSVSEGFVDDSTKSGNPVGNPLGKSTENSNKVVNINIPGAPNLQESLSALVRFSNCNIQNVNIYYNQ